MPTIAETALALARAGFPVLALYAHDEGEKGERGKRPRQARWEGRVNTPQQVAYWFDHKPKSNLGLVCGAMSGLVCVDIDPRNGGQAWYDQHRAQLCGGIVEVTGSGGLHVWFRHPGGFVVSHTGKHGLAPGVELKADGGHQVVITPSLHPCGKPYTCEMDFLSVREFAEVLPDWIARSIIAPEKRQRRKETYTDNPLDIELCRARLEAVAPAVEGAGGDHQTFVAACLGRDHDLSESAFLPLLMEWNKRCSPPWSHDDLVEKMRHAYRYAKAVTPGNASPSKEFSAVEYVAQEATQLTEEQARAQAEEMTDWADNLITDKNGNPKSCENNVDLILRKHHQLEGLLRWNLFTNCAELATNPPWKRGGEATAEWSEDDDLGLLLWLGRMYRVPFDVQKIGRTVASVAKRSSYHPVREFLQRSTWDQTPRLDRLLAGYFGAEANPYTAAIGRCAMIAAVARVMRPGCKVDTMLILEGEGGTYKSTALRVLAGDDWFTDAEIDPANKDAALAIRGRWIVEMGELHGLRRAEAHQLKAWVSRQTDRQRDPFARRMSDYPRQSVFIGTTNQEHYLKDETGNRRYWPCRCGDVDVEGLRRDRDQLWAEALARFNAGEPWWLSKEVEALAQQQQADRFTLDPWEEIVALWLETGKDFEGKRIEKTTAREVLQSALSVEPHRITSQDVNRVGAIMRRLKWKRGPVWISGNTVRGYARP